MQCRTCLYEVPAGVAFCPNCGTPTAANAGTPPPLTPPMFASSPNQEIPPTIAAQVPGQPVPPYAPPPPTNYGESAPPPPPVAPVNPYAAPPQPSYNPMYTAQSQYAPGTYPPQFVQPQPAKKNNGCVIALIIVLVILVLLVGGGVAAGVYIFHGASNAVATTTANYQTAVPTFSSDLTPTEGTGSAPTTSQIDASAAQMITGYQAASALTSDNGPANSQTTFNAGDKIYVTFKTSGQAGYAEAKWYLDGEYGFSSDPLQLTSDNDGGYFAGYFNYSGTAVIGLYWCTQSDCSDAALAQVVTVTVS